MDGEDFSLTADQARDLLVLLTWVFSTERVPPTGVLVRLRSQLLKHLDAQKAA